MDNFYYKIANHPNIDIESKINILEYAANGYFCKDKKLEYIEMKYLIGCLKKGETCLNI